MKTTKTLSGALNVLDALSKHKNINDYICNQKNNDSAPEINEYIIREINPYDIVRWKYKDRPSNELGDIESLSDEFKKIGQQQPCIVRKILNQNKYELIIGERRWHASKKAQLNLKVIIQDIDDNTAALIQTAENDSRKDLSDFAKGMSLSNLISHGIIKQKDLETKLGKSKQEISRLLSFSRIEKEVFDAINIFSNVSSRTAYEISRLSNKGSEYVNALISISEKIRTGKYGANKIISIVDSIIQKKCENEEQIKTRVLDKEGRHLFCWRKNNNNYPSIHFPKDIADMFETNKIDIELLTEEIKNEISRQLKNSRHMATKKKP